MEIELHMLDNSFLESACYLHRSVAIHLVHTGNGYQKHDTFFNEQMLAFVFVRQDVVFSLMVSLCWPKLRSDCTCNTPEFSSHISVYLSCYLGQIRPY